MSNVSTQTETEMTTPFTQADEGSGRPSQTAQGAEQDRLQENQDTFLSQDAYKELSLPPALEGCEEQFASFKKLAAELKLPAETVEKLMQWEAQTTENSRQLSDQQRTHILQKWTQQSKELWGGTYQQEIARALQAAQRFGGPELRELLEVTGLGSHPIVIKTFHAISQQISEDVSVSGRLRNSTDKTFAEALYGKAS